MFIRVNKDCTVNTDKTPKIPAEIQEMIANIKQATGEDVQISGLMIGPDGKAVQLTLAPNGELVPDTSSEPIDLGMVRGVAEDAMGRGLPPELGRELLKAATVSHMDHFSAQLEGLDEAGLDIAAKAQAEGDTERAERAKTAAGKASRMLEVVQLLRHSMMHDGNLPEKYETKERVTAAGDAVRTQVLEFLRKDGERHDAVLKQAADDYVFGRSGSIENLVTHLHERSARQELVHIFKLSVAASGTAH